MRGGGGATPTFRYISLCDASCRCDKVLLNPAAAFSRRFGSALSLLLRGIFLPVGHGLLYSTNCLNHGKTATKRGQKSSPTPDFHATCGNMLPSTQMALCGEQKRIGSLLKTVAAVSFFKKCPRVGRSGVACMGRCGSGVSRRSAAPLPGDVYWQVHRVSVHAGPSARGAWLQHGLCGLRDVSTNQRTTAPVLGSLRIGRYSQQMLRFRAKSTRVQKC